MSASPTRLAHVTTVPMTLGFLRGHIDYLRGHAYQVAVVSSPGDDLNAFGSQHQVRTHGVAMERQMSPFNDAVSLYRLWRLFRRLHPDIVHSHSPKAGLLGTVAARAAGVPVVYLSIFGLAQMTKTGPTRRLLDATTRLACRLADRVWCDSESMRSYVAAQGLCDPEKLMVVGNGSVGGIDAAVQFAPDVHRAASAQIRETFGIPEDSPVLGYVGRLTRDKGTGELARAWGQLREKYEDLHLLLVGPFEAGDPLDPADEQILRSDPRVHLAGMQHAVAPFLGAMTVFAMPSYREGFGMTNLEAAAMGLPVVATDIPGCTDSVADGATGTLVPVADVPALTSAIDRYLGDEALRRAHGNAGRRRALEEFQPERMWTELAASYAASLASRR